MSWASVRLIEATAIDPRYVSSENRACLNRRRGSAMASWLAFALRQELYSQSRTLGRDHRRALSVSRCLVGARWQVSPWPRAARSATAGLGRGVVWTEQAIDGLLQISRSVGQPANHWQLHDRNLAHGKPIVPVRQPCAIGLDEPASTSRECRGLERRSLGRAQRSQTPGQVLARRRTCACQPEEGRRSADSAREFN